MMLQAQKFQILFPLVVDHRKYGVKTGFINYDI